MGEGDGYIWLDLGVRGVESAVVGFAGVGLGLVEGHAQPGYDDLSASESTTTTSALSCPYSVLYIVTRRTPRAGPRLRETYTSPHSPEKASSHITSPPEEE